MKELQIPSVKKLTSKTGCWVEALFRERYASRRLASQNVDGMGVSGFSRSKWRLVQNTHPCWETEFLKFTPSQLDDNLCKRLSLCSKIPTVSGKPAKVLSFVSSPQACYELTDPHSSSPLCFRLHGG